MILLRVCNSFYRKDMKLNYPPCKTFEVRNCENMENTLKINVFGKSKLFCKYLRNGSLDLIEILCGGQFLNLSFKFHKDPCINVRARVVNGRIRNITRAFTTCARLFIHRSAKNFKPKFIG